MRSRESTSGSTTRPVACGCFPAIGLRQVSRTRGGDRGTGLQPRIPGWLRLRPGSPPTWACRTRRNVEPRPSARCGEFEGDLRFDEHALCPAVARSRTPAPPSRGGGCLSTSSAPCANAARASASEPAGEPVGDQHGEAPEGDADHCPHEDAHAAAWPAPRGLTDTICSSSTRPSGSSTATTSPAIRPISAFPTGDPADTVPGPPGPHAPAIRYVADLPLRL